MQGLAKSTYGFHRLESLADNKSPVHNMNSMFKTLLTVCYVVLVVSFDKYDLLGMIPFIIFPLFIGILADIPAGILFSRVAIALPFCVFAGIANLILDKTVLFKIGSIPITAGMVSFTSIIVKTLLTVSAVLILIATTRMDDISRQFIRLKIPAFFINIINMIYRYISVTLSEAINMYTAYKLRAPKEKGIKLKDFGSFAGQLFLRSFDRGDRIYGAMKCRGYDGRYSYITNKKVSIGELFVFIIILASLILLRIFNVTLIIGGLFA